MRRIYSYLAYYNHGPVPALKPLRSDLTEFIAKAISKAVKPAFADDVPRSILRTDIDAVVQMWPFEEKGTVQSNL